MAFQKFTGAEYLKIDIASNFGCNMDKADWNNRITWFNANECKLESLVSQAEEPALFYAGVKAWRDYQAKKPSGYMISLDATASGLQLLAVLTGDMNASMLCNVVDTGHRNDAYTIIYQNMIHKLGDVSKITRDDTKQAIMTSLYGSTAVPKEVFGEGELLKMFLDTMIEEAPGAWELNEAFLSMWNPNALSHDWVLPDNFHAHIKVMGKMADRVHFLNEPFTVFYQENMAMESGRSLGANTIHSLDGMIVREITRRCDYNPYTIRNLRRIIEQGGIWGRETTSPNDKLVITLWDHYLQSGYLSARILSHLDENNMDHVDIGVIIELLNSLPTKPFKVVSIHDCFRCLPNHGNDLRIQYNIQLHEIAKSNLLSYLISQIVARPVHIGKLNPNLSASILDTNYALS